MPFVAPSHPPTPSTVRSSSRDSLCSTRTQLPLSLRSLCYLVDIPFRLSSHIGPSAPPPLVPRPRLGKHSLQHNHLSIRSSLPVVPQESITLHTEGKGSSLIAISRIKVTFTDKRPLSPPRYSTRHKYSYLHLAGKQILPPLPPILTSSSQSP